MIKKIELVFQYILFYFTSDTKYDIHSPFVFQFVTNVLNKRKDKAHYHDIELVRQRMLKSKTEIELIDFGAKKSNSQKVRLSKLTHNTSKSAKYAELLERICDFYQPQWCIEIGTSVGISTLYQSIGIKNGVLFGLEGNPKSVEIAKYNAEKLEIQNIQFLEGNFDQTLPYLVSQIPQIDYVFFDGNHTIEATLKYFEVCLPKINNNTIMVFDDIRWSDEMNLAWNKITKHPQVSLSIDLFMMGIVFFRKELSKEEYQIRF